MTESEIIAKIKVHKLGNTTEAFELYNCLCDTLKEKYGLVDKDYDENPTKRGTEWLDIHHILEYELGDISNLTQSAKFIEQRMKTHAPNEVIIRVPRSPHSEFSIEKTTKFVKCIKEKTYIYTVVNLWKN